MSEILIMITTEPNEEKAKDIAKSLIQKRLAACVSIKNINSIYKWNNVIEETRECEITIKTKPELKESLIMFLKKMTSYDVPQILYHKFHADAKYNNWINKNI